MNVVGFLLLEALQWHSEAVPLDSCVSVAASTSVRQSVSALAHDREGLDQSQLGMDAVQRNQRNTQNEMY